MQKIYYPLFLLFCIVTITNAQTVGGDWESYGADKAGTKYSPINQINPGNADKLKIAWRWISVDQPILNADSDLWTWRNESTPIMVDGVLYTSTALSQVAAIDAITGETRWVYNPESYRVGSPPNNGFLHRGVTYWDEGPEPRIFIGTGDAHLIAINASTGEPIASFGDEGKVDLTQGLRRFVNRIAYGVSSPPVVCNGVVVVGSSIWDYPGLHTMAPGDVRGFDPITGEQLWVFESIPQGDDFGAETWEEGSGAWFGNTNVWAPMTCDEALGQVYLPFSTPTNDYYGGERPGDNLFGESLVSLNAATGERVWHYQIVHHGVWDYDLPAAPNLLDIVVDGAPIKAVAQVTKHGFLFVFNRETGEPVWPIEEREVPGPGVTGERLSPTQPFPTWPLPFEQQGATEDDLIDFTDELRSEALGIFQRYVRGPLFQPPSFSGTITVPGVSGGGSWAGAAVNPKTGRLYVPSIKGVWTLRVWANTHLSDTYSHVGAPGYGPMGPQNLPIMKPPYGRITSYDMHSGEQQWYSAVGNGPRYHAAIQHLDLPPLGWARRIFVALTDSVLIAAQEGINYNRGGTPRGNATEIGTLNSDPSVKIFHPASGEQIASIPLPHNAGGAPITYMAGGLQYIVVPVGGASQPAQLVALALDPVDVAAEEAMPLPESQVLLDQNYPNPFARGTTIHYTLATPSQVEISVYTVTGELVTTLVNGVKEAGRHAVQINAEGLANGLYLYRLRTEAGTITKKLLVIK